MKIWAWAAAVGSVVGLVACGGGGTGNSGGGGAGGTAPTTSSSSGSTMTTVSSSSSGSTMTTSSSGKGGAPMGCGSFLFSTDATCEACAEGSCCAELTACDSGTACNDLFNCIDACMTGDMACQQQCITDHSDGGADAQALIDCGNASCKMECTTPGTICDTMLTHPNPDCGDCLGAQCCMQFEACVADALCKDCITGVTKMGCDTNAAYMAATTCQKTTCGDKCGATICDSGLSTSNGKCDTCLGTNCCGVIDTCYGLGTANEGNTACFKNCLSQGMPAASCATDAQYQAVKTCWNTNCAGANDCGGML